MKIFGKTEYSLRPFAKDINLPNAKNINFRQNKKLIPSFSTTNYFRKPKKIPFFLRTINNFNLEKLKNLKQNNIPLRKMKLKKSSSEIFQSNDVDLVRNLNFDSLTQYYKNTQLRESLVNSLKDNENDKNKNTNNNKNNENNENNNNKKQNEEVNLPRLTKLAKYKSYEIIQSHKKKIKIELSEQLQKELINKLKNLRNECQIKKLEKDKIFLKIKKIEEQLDEIDAENYYYKENYKKQISDISKKRKESPEKKQEILRYRYKANLEKKKKKINIKSNLMDIFNVDKKDNNNNNNHSKSKNNNASQDTSNISQIKNDSPKQSENINNKQNIDFTTPIKPETKIQDQKKLESFEINLLQTQRKKEFENFQKHQDDKINNLKEDWKQLDNIINKIDSELEDIKKKEKKIVNRLMTYYKEILFKGKNVKKDGLVWIIKAMWNLGENVPMPFMPEFLDFESIDYLFKLAHKQIEIENCNKKIIELKLKLKKEIGGKYDYIKLNTISNNKSNDFNESNNMPSMIKAKEYLKMKRDSQVLESENKKDVYKDLVKEFEEKNLQFEIINLPEIGYIREIKKHIHQIESDITEMKRKEIRRICRCFIEFDYENKFHTDIETVLSALVGIDAKDTEMNKYNVVKKEYITKLKKIRFFDHEHIRKILSK